MTIDLYVRVLFRFIYLVCGTTINYCFFNPPPYPEKKSGKIYELVPD